MGKLKPLAEEIRKEVLELASPNTSSKKKTVQNIDALLTKIYLELSNKKEIKKEEIKIKEDHHILKPDFDSEKFTNLSETTKKKYLKELNIDKKQLSDFIKKEKKRQEVVLKKDEYSIYAPSKIGHVANKYAKHYADMLVSNYPKFFEPLFNSFEKVNMPLFSRTYVSMMVFFAVLSIPFAIVLTFLLNISFQIGLAFIIIATMLAPFLTFMAMYFYPRSLEGDKGSKIKLELPFALVHMSAVAGSGAHPVSIFELLANSKEYPELKKEIRKLMNYINLYGYNLTTALKNVAESTPSKELKELFNGIITTIETGGDLNDYLKLKAKESLNTYKLYRKKKVEALATYSEIYTAILIAAPLLLVVTLAIMGSAGGLLGGMNVKSVGWIAIGVVLPLLNIGFMMFLGGSKK